MNSRNCLREARAAMASSKPLVLVREADLQKGGLLLADARAQCPADLSVFVFAERHAITWHRVAEYQRLALKLIAEQLLQACPCIVNPLEVDPRSEGLRFKGEVTCADLAFARHVTLLVSAHNAGADELATELSTALPAEDERFSMVSVAEDGDGGEACLADILTSLRAPLSERARQPGAVFFLLYLKDGSFAGEAGARLAEQLRLLRAAELKHATPNESPFLCSSRLVSTASHLLRPLKVHQRGLACFTVFHSRP